MNMQIPNQYLLILAFLLLPAVRVFGQQYDTETGTSSFEVQAPAKTIKGVSDAVSIRIDLKQGTVALRVPVQTFVFRNNFVADSLNSVIRNRFNSYYMESNRFPAVVYTGNIKQQLSARKSNSTATFFHTTGILKLHGVARQITAEGTLAVSSGQAIVHADIIVKPVDWGIHIPSYIGDMYFREVKIEIDGTLKNTGRFPKAK
jgi:hypothetical protein